MWAVFSHILLHVIAQAYLILDEFVIGGELQETAIQVILDRLAELEKLDT